MISGLKPIAEVYVNRLSFGLERLAGSQKMNKEVSEQIIENAYKLGENISNTKKIGYLNKVCDKATSDWMNSNKTNAFFIKNSKKIVKGGFMSVAAVAIGFLAAGLISLADRTINKE